MNRQDLALVLQSFTGLGEALKKQRDEQITRELLKRVDPNYHGEPIAAYRIQRQVEDDNLNRQLKNAQLQNSLHNNDSDPVMDDLQYRKAYADTTRSENAAYGDGTDDVDEQIRQDREKRLREQFEAKQQGDWPAYRALARGRLNPNGQFDNNYAEAAQGDMTQVVRPDGSKIVVPWTEYQRRTRQQPAPQMNRAMNGTPGVQPTQTEAPVNDTDERAKQIRAAYKAGTITRDEAKAKLQALGFE